MYRGLDRHVNSNVDDLRPTRFVYLAVEDAGRHLQPLGQEGALLWSGLVPPARTKILGLSKSSLSLVVFRFFSGMLLSLPIVPTVVA